MPFTTLISSDELAAHLGDPDLVVIDCRFDLADVAAGERSYRDGHVPGAVYGSLDRDLSGAKTGSNGRHPLPDPETLAQTFGRWGIDQRTQVVAYDQDSGMYASRLWWELRWLGHDAVAVLDGGWAKWQREQRPITATIDPRTPRTFVPQPRADLVATVADVERLRQDDSWRLVDARAPERFRGENETIDRVAGHIPGAANHFFKTNLTDAGTFRSADELRSGWSADNGGTPADRIICYCGSGVTACHNLLAMEHAGLHGARLYVGSWSEWSADPSRPVEGKS
jgi:thiosulfate/3-mercaptopyruvate sulfurtransferase